jgi:hypothetical protein
VQFAMTDREGFYRLADVLAGSTAIAASKWGHATVLKNVTVAGDMDLDLPSLMERARARCRCPATRISTSG